MRTLQIVNLSSETLPDGWIEHMHDALQQGLGHVAQVWSNRIWHITEALHSQGFQIRLVDALPEAPGALAYHDLDGSGPFIRIGMHTIMAAGGGWYTGPYSIPSVVAHECFELVGDPACNLWANDRNGVNWARELADPCEGDSYTVATQDGTRVDLSDFVFPDYFNPFAAPGTKLDWMGVLTVPFEIRSDGYAIREDAGKITQVFGAAYPEARRALKHRALERAAWFKDTTVVSETAVSAGLSQ